MTTFTIQIGAEPMVTVSLSPDAVTSITSNILAIAAPGAVVSTLAAAAASGDGTLTLASFAGIAQGMGLLIDAEVCGVAVTPTTGVVTVLRGQLGTVAAAHALNAPVNVLASGIYGNYVAGLISSAVRQAMTTYPATAIKAANATIVTATAAIQTAVAGAVTFTP